MPDFFPNAQGVDLRHATMNEIHGNQNIEGDQIIHTAYISYSSEKKTILDSLRPADQSGSYARPCMDGTRAGIFQKVWEWMEDRTAKNILWLSGSPGAGKSAIASSLISKMVAARRTNSSFFFKRGDVTLSDPAVVWRTISSGLARYNAKFADSVVKNLQENLVDPTRPDISNHFTYLIEEPLVGTYGNSDAFSEAVIVIDALDECGRSGVADSQRLAFLKTLQRWAVLGPKFRLVVTGRNDRMPDWFWTICEHMELRTGLDASPESNEDLRLFFTMRFADIDRKPSEGWPGQDIINDLTKRAAGLFIWAETMMNFLHQDVLEEQLDEILKGNFGGGEDIDQLYKQILVSSFANVSDKTLKSAQAILKTIILARTPLLFGDLQYIVPEIKSSTLTFILDRLSSVIYVRDAKRRLLISHLSFSEFLCDPSRCPEPFAVDRVEGNLSFALACFRIMNRLHFNMCGLETSHLSNDAIPDLAQRLEESIPSYFSYSSRFFASHISDVKNISGETLSPLLSAVNTFLSEQLLFWLEVMSFLKNVSEASVALSTVSIWLESYSNELSHWARDSSRFTIYFHAPISHSVPHIYISALPFAPTESWVAKQYQAQYPRTISVAAGADRNWPACIHALTGHTRDVKSIAFSPDGTKIVSGSSDNTVCVWDMQSGQITSGPFEISDAWIAIVVGFSQDGEDVIGCTDSSASVWNVDNGQLKARTAWSQNGSVRSLALSSDGSMVAYGCSGGKISLFDVTAGLQIAEFDNGSDVISSIAFSPDCTKIVSGSARRLVSVWDIGRRCIIAGPFADHDGWVEAVAFSSDGTKVVSGASQSIRVWDIIRGDVVAGPFTGHTMDITSVGFSQDDAFVLSGSEDNTIRIWDVKTGETIAGPFEGHTDKVTSVRFSASGLSVLSASEDFTIRVWDAKTGISPVSSDNHTKEISSVCFSRDGHRIASGSSDDTLRVWDARRGRMLWNTPQDHVSSVCYSSDGKEIVAGSYDGSIAAWNADNGILTTGPLKGHSDWVLSVDVSPDGHLVASSHLENIIHIWDITQNRTTPIASFKGHKEAVTSVNFSPDGLRLVSGSRDNTICVWNVRDGRTILGPLKGHKQWVTSVRFSRDGAYLVSGSYDRTVRVWNAETGELHTKPFGPYPHRVLSVDISPDGTKVIAGSMKVIIIRNTSDGKIEGTIEGHSDRVTSVSFSPDGEKIVSASGDCTIRVWSMNRYVSDDGSGISEDQMQVCSPINGYQLSSCQTVESHGWALVKRVVEKQSPNRLRKFHDLDSTSETLESSESSDISHSSDKSKKSGSDSSPHSSKDAVVVKKRRTLSNESQESEESGESEEVGSGESEEVGSPRGSERSESEEDNELNHPEDTESHVTEDTSSSNEKTSDKTLELTFTKSRLSDNCLFWVPPNHRHALCDMDTLAIMGSRRTQVDFKNFVHGKSWVKCRLPRVEISSPTEALSKPRLPKPEHSRGSLSEDMSTPQNQKPQNQKPQDQKHATANARKPAPESIVQPDSQVNSISLQPPAPSTMQEFENPVLLNKGSPKLRPQQNWFMRLCACTSDSGIEYD